MTSADHKGVTCYGLRGRGVESRSLMTSAETRDLSGKAELEHVHGGHQVALALFITAYQSYEVFVSKVLGGNVTVGFHWVHHVVVKDHVVSLLVFGRFYTYVSFCRSLNFSEEFLASGVRFVEELLAQRWGSGNGTSQVYRFFKTFGDLHNPCHVIVVGA